MRNTSQNNKLQIVNVEEKDDVKVLYLDVNEINNKNIADFMTLPGGVSFVLAFISIDSDIDKAGKLLQEALPSDAKFMMVSAIGELYSTVGGRTTYPPMKEHRQKILLQAFSKRMVKKCEIISIPLHNEDLLEEREDISIDERIDLIKNEFDTAHSKINFPINSQDTVALTYIDGVSKCESFVVQAIYESKNYPCIFIGGSASGKMDFKNTYLHNGEKVLENHAVICFMKLNHNYKFGLFKTQGFVKGEGEYIIADADPANRYVSKVLDKNGKLVNFIDVLKERFNAESVEELLRVIANYTFATEINNEIFSRTILKIDEEKNRVYFYCDLAVGEKIIVVNRVSFLDTLKNDWQEFMFNKTKPIAGIVNDCITRRNVNADAIPKIDIFDDINMVGFSCFGEFFGVHMNDTLTAIFFFKVEDDEVFQDKYYDYFPIVYGEFKSYFLLRRLKQMQIISKLEDQVIGLFSRYDKNNDTDEVNNENIWAEVGFTGNDILKSNVVLKDKSMSNVLTKLNKRFHEYKENDLLKEDINLLVSCMQVILKNMSLRKNDLERKVMYMEQSLIKYTKDELTEVFTRRSGYEIISKMMNQQAHIYDYLTFAFIDVDNLKIVNDAYGHKEGDYYLKTIVDEIKTRIRGNDIICRYGGDEFIVVLPNCEERRARDIFEEINKNLPRINKIRDKKYKMSFSFGILRYDYESEMTFDDFIKTLDAKMYYYKKRKYKASNL